MPESRRSATRPLIVWNRLPVTAAVAGDAVTLTAAAGGLATGLQRWHEGSGGLWIGWPGDVSQFTPEQHADLARQLEAQAIVPVTLSREQITRYYHGFANRVLWPLFHYLIDRIPVHAARWEAYREASSPSSIAR